MNLQSQAILDKAAAKPSLLSRVEQLIAAEHNQPVLNLVQQIEDQLAQLEQFILSNARSNARSLQTDP